MPHISSEAVMANRRVVADVSSRFQWEEDNGHPGRSDTTRHFVAWRIPLREAYEDLLSKLWFPDFEESQTYLTHLLLIRRLLDADPMANATVYLMSKGSTRVRSLDQKDQIDNLFQGAVPVTPKSQRGSIYPGDLRVCDEQAVSIQIHVLDLLKDGELLISGVPTVALILPDGLSADLVVQPQGNSQ
jgi:hypothetical protein